MENKEPSPPSPITPTEIKTKPKDPGRIAAGKKLAEYNRKAREAKKASKSIRENQEIPNEQGSFSLTPILSVASIVVSLAGLYYKRKELMSFVKPSRERRVRSNRRNNQRRSRASARMSSRSRKRSSFESQRFKIETN